MEPGKFERQRQIRIVIAQDNAAALLLKTLLFTFEKIYTRRQLLERERTFAAGANRSE
jgi:hypothetical protein